MIAIFTVSLTLHLPKISASNFQTNLKRVDFSGAITLVLTIFFLLFGLDRGGNISWNDNLTVFTLLASLVLFILFSVIELKFASEPFAPKRIILNRSLIASYLVNFFGMASGLSILFHISLYLQAVHGKTPFEAGLWLLPSIAGGVLGSVAGGLIMQSTGKYYILTVASYTTLLSGTMVVMFATGVMIRSLVGVALGNLRHPRAVQTHTMTHSSSLLGLVLTSLGNGMKFFFLVDKQGLDFLIAGSGVTTSLIDIIANAGPEDQAMGTAGKFIIIRHIFKHS